MSAELHKVAVVGCGYMGGGIAQMLALAGCRVTLGDVDAATANNAYARITAQATSFERDGLLPAGSAERIRAGVTPKDSIEEAVEATEYVTEAAPEARSIKAEVLSRISAAAPAGAIIASNTSAIPIAELAKSVASPRRFLGVHWMNPAPFIPGVELIATEHTSAEVLTSVEQLIRRAGKIPARVSDSPGFVANRLQFALFKEAVLMVEEGLATAEQIDLVVSNAFGFRLALFGPFAIADMAGLDVYNASYDSLRAEYGERLAAPAALTELVAGGHLGMKSGGGFLDIPPSEHTALLAYRDTAYARLSQLRAELGAAPGLGS